MRKQEKHDRSDLEECKERIQQLLREYNCELCSTYDYSSIFLRDKDTDERSSL